MQKGAIGLDIDGVLLRQVEERFLEFYAQSDAPVDFNVYRRTHSMSLATGLEGQKLDDAFFAFTQDSSYEQFPIPGAHQALLVLQQRYQLHLLTGRACKLQILTEKLLAQHFPGVQYASYNFGYYERKAACVAERGLNWVIDDSNMEIRGIAERAMGVQVIQFPKANGHPHDPVDLPNVRRLEACNAVGFVAESDFAPYWQQAWQEIVTLLS